MRRGGPGTALVGAIVGLVMSMAGAAHSVVLLDDRFEGAWPGSWQVRSDDPGDPRWGRTTQRRWSGRRSLHCTAGGPNATVRGNNYPPNVNGSWLVYGPVNLTGTSQCVFSFKAWVDTEPAHDVLEAGLSLDDQTYEFVSFSGRSRAWKTYRLSARDPRFATDYTGHPQVYFGLRFRSDAAVAYQGVYVDDVRIEATQAVGKVEVRVRDGGGEGVGKVHVRLSPAGLMKLTNSEGRCEFEHVPVGTQTVIPSGLGATFTPPNRQVVVTEGEVEADFTATVPPPNGVTCYAICIGVTSDLAYPDDDARDIRDALIARGWPAGNITMLVDAAPTTAAIRAAINQVIARADNDDLVLFSQSGHGGRRADQAPLDEADGMDEFLSTVDGSYTDDELAQWLAELPTMKLITVFDSCYVGGMFVNGVRRSADDWAADFAGEVQGRLRQMRTADLNDWGGGVSIASCADSELSFEVNELHNGLFTYYVVEAMRTNAADVSGNGWISAEEVFAYAAPRVTQRVSRQHPQMFDGHPGELDFASTAILQQMGLPRIDSLLTVNAVAAGTHQGAAISVRLSAAASVRCEIVNIAGRRVAALAEAELPAGAHTLLWNGRNVAGSLCPRGAYVVQVTAADAKGQVARAMAVLRTQ